MRFTLFANYFTNSDSRNPLMRFGTFHILNNLFASTASKAPLFGTNLTTPALGKRDKNEQEEDVHPFQYHLGIYNQSKVVVSGNIFEQDGEYLNDTTRIFTYSDLTRADIPAILCVRADRGGFVDTFNGKPVTLDDVAMAKFRYQVDAGSAVKGGLVQKCEGLEEQIMPKEFASAEDVRTYILKESGQF
jgi:pectate lyase